VGSNEEVTEARDDTQSCMECHDGTQGAAVILKIGATKRGMRGNGVAAIIDDYPATNHPVDIVYPDYSPDLKGKFELDSSIELPGGMITCVTCHPLDRTLSNNRSELCLQRHIK